MGNHCEVNKKINVSFPIPGNSHYFPGNSLGKHWLESFSEMRKRREIERNTNLITTLGNNISCSNLFQDVGKLLGNQQAN